MGGLVLPRGPIHDAAYRTALFQRYGTLSEAIFPRNIQLLHWVKLFFFRGVEHAF